MEAAERRSAPVSQGAFALLAGGILVVCVAVAVGGHTLTPPPPSSPEVAARPVEQPAPPVAAPRPQERDEEPIRGRVTLEEGTLVVRDEADPDGRPVARVVVERMVLRVNSDPARDEYSIDLLDGRRIVVDKALVDALPRRFTYGAERAGDTIAAPVPPAPVAPPTEIIPARD